MDGSINVVRCLTGESVAMAFSAVGSVSWNERLCACMYRTVTVFNTSLSVADAKCCLLRCRGWKGSLWSVSRVRCGRLLSSLTCGFGAIVGWQV